MSASVCREAERGANIVLLHDRSPLDVFVSNPAADFPVVEKQRVQKILRIE
jgi:hypothetical protein